MILNAAKECHQSNVGDEIELNIGAKFDELSWISHFIKSQN